ncbi:MAG: peptide deformylase [Lentisphaeria bacterium]
MKKAKVLKVRTYGDSVLRKVSTEIEVMTPELEQLAFDMVATMKDECGIGLAAPQVGINLRMIAIGVNGVYDNDLVPADATPGERLLWDIQPLVMINPKIKKFSQELSVLDEGCLSIPKLNAEVVRPSEIEVEATIVLERGDVLVNRQVSFSCGNLLATCFQHEIDHLDGILYVDRASDDEKKYLETSLKRLEKLTLKKLSK